MIEKDITIPAQMILSCVQQIYRKLGYYIGATLVVRTLRGSSEKRILALNLNELSAYGMMSRIARTDIRAMMEELEGQGYLQTDSKHGVVFPTEKARRVLFEHDSVYMQIPATMEPIKKDLTASQVNDGLLAVLKTLRFHLAKEAKVPAYIIFSNATLQDMAIKAPQTMEAFLRVNGVGQYKAEQYGEAFLSEINRYLEGENND